ncbi:DUF402 domain-containing protein [Actinopolymorpha sp. B11F2]|uniref:DUF402 domain-containing protein n=1 Tax=Actinopolymorpha sp. B11F2 TaxID=3160862 RepID=UPI0032E3DFE8
MTTPTRPPFGTGTTVTRRDALRGKVLSAVPCRAICDTGHLLALARWPGVEGLWEATWIEWLRTGDNAYRSRLIDNLATGDWRLAPWTWRDTTKLDLLMPGMYFSVSLFFVGAEQPNGWYVDFVRPYRRTPIGIDTFDLLLDLVIDLDLSFRWKDEEEYNQARRLGVITDTDHRRVEQAREQVIALLKERAGPFEDRWLGWQRDPSWALPILPVDTLTLATTQLS